MRVTVVADQEDRDGGFVTERLVELGADLVEIDRAEIPSFGPGADLVLLLGSDRSAHEAVNAKVVRAESAYVRDALTSGVPVMGICYGAQLVARALGGDSWRSDRAELGWQPVETVDPVLCPSGPWGQMHKDVFSAPPTSTVLGTSWRGPQCFVDEAHGARAIAWQFHPEVTPTTYERWVRSGYTGDGEVDADDLVRQGYAAADASRTAAHGLIDAALEYLAGRSMHSVLMSR